MINDDNNINTNFDDSDVYDDDDNNNNDGRNELRRRYNNLRRPMTIPNDNDEEELLCRYNKLKALPNSEEELIDTVTLERVCFETYCPHHLFH